MALSTKKSTEKTSASKSLIELPFSDLTKPDRPQVSKRRRSVSESAYHKDPQLDLIFSDLNPSSSLSSGSSQSESLFLPNYPNQTTAYTYSEGFSDDVVQTTFNKTSKDQKGKNNFYCLK